MKKFVNPFTIAFAFGVVFLTVLPVLQGRFLKAPPPIGPLGTWALRNVDSNTAVTSEGLTGHVVIATLVPDRCEKECVDRVDALGRALEHTDDLGDVIRLVAFVRPGARDAVKGKTIGRFALVTGAQEELDPLLLQVRENWRKFAGTDAGTTAAELAALPAFILIDQQGAVRGFWRDDVAGRGNAINAARLLAKRGPQP